jgi:hypothetical protein
MQPMQHMSAFMQQCLVIMLHDAHGQVLVTFNIWDVTTESTRAEANPWLVKGG